MSKSLIIRLKPGIIVPTKVGTVRLGDERVDWSEIDALSKRRMAHKVHAFFRFEGNWYLFCSPSYVGYLAVFSEDDPPLTDAEVDCIRCWKRYTLLIAMWEKSAPKLRIESGSS